MKSFSAGFALVLLCIIANLQMSAGVVHNANVMLRAAPKENSTRKLPEQGFSGKTAEHKNGKTVTADWHNEYPTSTTKGPKPEPTHKNGVQSAAGLSGSVAVLMALRCFHF
mmetsp:Transcript_9397/g.13917  ORF Transcript_9397/g.13917 Transcript_9397/m.13917 type:complete len:111 (-) Transcript_9397:138-470(-)|eukprot:CAMPEP_0194762888 /NCGR_PEP_ID=MMETSP0323_2-20130528/17103_1 /TAXON_ID=2866 ORGANISM="Crypthecodinium cohnii, Strain Seligo" /NCGR_SAMPLE_ID=MMETSP0323_2 /ASSEMBLY_ACC=CAM_ASM_000346 /LENGTH=110 /DNA_ID=CAMNT_0039686315 /DNA_START=66 /DNA_END=398 /DNA_ORIENTATION=-